MTDEQVLRALQNCGAVNTNSHFCLTPKEIPPGSGIKRHFHSDTFIAKDRVFEYARELYCLAQEIADRHLAQTQNRPCDFVLGLEKGAIALANLVCHHLEISGHDHVRAGYAEAKSGGGFIIGRGFARNYTGRTVLIVEDIVVSGTSVRDAVEAVRENGGIPFEIWAICLRGNADTSGVPLNHLCKVDGAQMWPEEECPLCADPKWGPTSVRTDINKHGPEFFKRMNLPIPKQH